MDVGTSLRADGTTDVRTSLSKDGVWSKEELLMRRKIVEEEIAAAEREEEAVRQDKAIRSGAQELAMRAQRFNDESRRIGDQLAAGNISEGRALEMFVDWQMRHGYRKAEHANAHKRIEQPSDHKRRRKLKRCKKGGK